MVAVDWEEVHIPTARLVYTNLLRVLNAYQSISLQILAADDPFLAAQFSPKVA